MKNLFAVLIFITATSASAGVDIQFSGDCRLASFDAQEGEIEFSKLNLDLDAQEVRDTAKCEILTKFPVRKGYKLIVSSFSVQADALVEKDGSAALTLRHNFKDSGWKQDQARVNKPGDQVLQVSQKAVGNGSCDEPAQLKTEIISEARYAVLLQQAARNINTIKYKYEKCEVSAPPAATPVVRFSGVCADGAFETSGNEIGYSQLNLDLEESAGKIASAECTITTTLPAKTGFRITASDFKLQVDALVSDSSGLASIFVNHRFNGQDLDGVSANTRKDGPLVAKQATIGVTDCNQAVELRTKLTVKAKSSIVLQQDALARVASYKLGYTACN